MKGDLVVKLPDDQGVVERWRSDSRWWGFEHRCGGRDRVMGKDMGWVVDLATRQRRWVECIRCGGAIEFTVVW